MKAIKDDLTLLKSVKQNAMSWTLRSSNGVISYNNELQNFISKLPLTLYQNVMLPYYSQKFCRERLT